MAGESEIRDTSETGAGRVIQMPSGSLTPAGDRYGGPRRATAAAAAESELCAVKYARPAKFS